MLAGSITCLLFLLPLQAALQSTFSSLPAFYAVSDLIKVISVITDVCSVPDGTGGLVAAWLPAFVLPHRSMEGQGGEPGDMGTYIFQREKNVSQ